MSMKWGTVDGARYMRPKAKDTPRRRCRCGCKRWYTHVGMNNGVALISGCELLVRRWVRDGRKFRHPGAVRCIADLKSRIRRAK